MYHVYFMYHIQKKAARNDGKEAKVMIAEVIAASVRVALAMLVDPFKV